MYPLSSGLIIQRYASGPAEYDDLKNKGAGGVHSPAFLFTFYDQY